MKEKSWEDMLVKYPTLTDDQLHSYLCKFVEGTCRDHGVIKTSPLFDLLIKMSQK